MLRTYLTWILTGSSFSGLLRYARTKDLLLHGSLFSGLLRHTRRCWEYILTWLPLPSSHSLGSPFSGLLQNARGRWESIPTRILTSPISVASHDTQEDAEDLFSPGSSQIFIQWPFDIQGDAEDQLLPGCGSLVVPLSLSIREVVSSVGCFKPKTLKGMQSLLLCQERGSQKGEWP
jgi:hypothetical protein